MMHSKACLQFFIITLIFFRSVFPTTGQQNHTPIDEPSCRYTPWFAGTLLEPSSTNQAPQHVNIQPYLFYALYYGQYHDDWSMNTTKCYSQLIENIFGQIGITKHFQLEFVLQSQSTFFKDKTSSHFGDLSLKMGFQFLWDEKETAQPNLRVVITETFPTGRYQMLDPFFSGNDASGQGVYATSATAVVSKILYFIPCHPIYINASVNLSYLTSTKIKGVSVYGEERSTRGRIKDRGSVEADFSFEYSCTQQIVFACDFIYSHLFASSFVADKDASIKNVVNTKSSSLLTITPAIEYNFTADLALIVGGSFSFAGKNSPASAQSIASLTYAF